MAVLINDASGVSALSEDVGVKSSSSHPRGVHRVVVMTAIAMVLTGCGGASTNQGASGPDSSRWASGLSPTIPAGAFQARVTRIVDGDTFIASASGRRDIRVRLIGVNAPEIAHAGQRTQCYGPEATEVLRRLIGGSSVLAAYQSGGQRDKYGRDLWDVWRRGGTFVQGELVAQGAAHARAYRPQTEFAGYLTSVEGQARSNRVGLWGQCPSTG